MSNNLSSTKVRKMRPGAARRAIGALAFLTLPGYAFAGTAQTDRFVQGILAGKPSGRVGIILKTAKPLSKEDATELGRLGAFVYRRLPIINSSAVSVPTKNLHKVLDLAFVERASQDLEVKKTDAFTVGSSGADTAWHQYGATGDGIGVAVLDSGIHTDLDFFDGLHPRDRITAEVNFSPDSNTTSDLCGHGTHVAGILAGNGLSSTGWLFTQTYSGIAPQADLINVRVLNRQGGGTVSQVIAGLQWVLNNKVRYGIRVVNMSLGHPVGESYKTDPLCQAVETVWKSGVVVVCAAGNEGRAFSTATAGAPNEGYGIGYGSIQVPGNDPCVITVGAMKSVDGNRADDQIATYSGRGPSRLDFVVKPDIVAPGNGIVSVLSKGGYLGQTYCSTNGVPWADYMRFNIPGMSCDYFRMSGTSMAAPVVSGAVALMLQKQPNLSPDTVKARLMISADKWNTSTGDPDILTYGAGYLDIPGALASSVVATKTAYSPTAVRLANGTVTLNMDRAMWGTGFTDYRAMWGTGVGALNNTIEAPDGRAMWGTAVWTDMFTNPVYGTSVDLSATAMRGD